MKLTSGVTESGKSVSLKNISQRGTERLFCPGCKEEIVYYRYPKGQGHFQHKQGNVHCKYSRPHRSVAQYAAAGRHDEPNAWPEAEAPQKR